MATPPQPRVLPPHIPEHLRTEYEALGAAMAKLAATVWLAQEAEQAAKEGAA